MGKAYKYRCERCDFEQEFNQGHGFLVRSQPLADYLNLHKKLFHYKTQKVLEGLAKANNDLYLKAGFQVYKCPKCRVLHDKIEVTVLEENEIVHQSEFRCSTCRMRLKLTNIHRLKKAICPKCRHRTFQMNRQHNELWV